MSFKPLFKLSGIFYRLKQDRLLSGLKTTNRSKIQTELI